MYENMPFLYSKVNTGAETHNECGYFEYINAAI